MTALDRLFTTPESGEVAALVLTLQTERKAHAMTDRPTTCQCADPGCPTDHEDTISCGKPRTITLYRVDMDDPYGVEMCPDCADDAMAAGIFTDYEDEGDDVG